MSVDLWKMPVPPTEIIEGPYFTELPQRRCEISFLIEAENGGAKKVELTFESVAAFKCTYLGAISVELIKAAYGRLADIGQSAWFVEISQKTTAYHNKRATNEPPPLRHLAICFDEGPCFEIICTNFETKLLEGAEGSAKS